MQHHIHRFTARDLKDSGKYRDLRVLQDSPLFGLSECYRGQDGGVRELSTSPPGLNVTLRNYQMQAVQWMLDHEQRSSISEQYFVKVPMQVSSLRRGQAAVKDEEKSLYYCHLTGNLQEEPPSPNVGGILAEEMGLGKTIEILGLISLTSAASKAWQAQPVAAGSKPRGGTLIICPVSLFAQWENELKTKLNDDSQLSIYKYHTNRKIEQAKAMAAKHDITITCYSILNREQEGAVDPQNKSNRITSPLKEIDWYRIVMDESHAIKTVTSKQSKYCCSLQAKRRWSVTGTVMQTKHDDLAAILNFLKLEPFGVAKYWNHYVGKRLQDKQLSLLSIMMSDIVMRHMKTQMFQGKPILELPPRTQSVRLLEMSATEKKLYDELETKAKARFGAIPVGQHGAQTLKLMSFLLPLRQLCSSGAAVEKKGLNAEAERNEASERGSFPKSELLVKLSTAGVSDADRLKEIVGALDGTDNEAECTVCMDLVDSPVCTPCGHVFCAECIAMVVSTAGASTGPCPVCRKPVTDTSLMKLKPVVDTGAKDAADLSREKLLRDISEGGGLGGHKVLELLKDLRAMKRSNPKEKAVVFTSFAKTHIAIVKALEAKKIGVVELRGNMTQKARAKSLQQFIDDPKITVFALSLRTGACGLTLTAASRCYLMEPCINEGTELQAMNRIYRMGQTKKVKIITFVSKGSIEERLLQLRQERKDQAVASGSAADGDGTGTGAGSVDISAAAAAAAVQPVGLQRGRGRRGGGGSLGVLAAGGTSASNDAMANFDATRERVNAKEEEWQLLFGNRAATSAADLGDPEPVIAAGGGGAAAGDDDADDDNYGDDEEAGNDLPPASKKRRRRSKNSAAAAASAAGGGSAAAAAAVSAPAAIVISSDDDDDDLLLQEAPAPTRVRRAAATQADADRRQAQAQVDSELDL